MSKTSSRYMREIRPATKKVLKRWRLKHINLQGNFCAVCEFPMNTEHRSAHQATLDHIIPVSQGGLHMFENTQVLCRQCHVKKDHPSNMGVG